MSSAHADLSAPAPTDTAATFDDALEDGPAFLAPRLATYASPSVDSLDDSDDAEPAAEEEEEADHGRAVLIGPSSTLETAAGDAPSGSSDAADDGAVGVEEVDEEDEGVADTADAWELDDESENENDDGERGSAGGWATGAAEEDYTTAFPVSRVKDLLKFEGSSTIISRDACLAASEAVALLLREMAKAGAAEAQRRGRKTVTYDDVAKSVQMFDCLSFLSDVVPPNAAPAAGRLPTTARQTASGAANALVVLDSQRAGERGGAPRQQPKRQPQQRAAAAAAASHAPKKISGAAAAAAAAPLFSGGVGRSGAHPMIPGADTKRQSTLRF